MHIGCDRLDKLFVNIHQAHSMVYPTITICYSSSKWSWVRVPKPSPCGAEVRHQARVPVEDHKPLTHRNYEKKSSVEARWGGSYLLPSLTPTSGDESTKVANYRKLEHAGYHTGQHLDYLKHRCWFQLPIGHPVFVAGLATSEAYDQKGSTSGAVAFLFAIPASSHVQWPLYRDAKKIST